MYLSGSLGIAAAVSLAAFGQTVRDVYVDSVKGSDSALGSHSEPLKSIAQATVLAMRNYANGIGARIHVAPGVYRETITLRGTSATSGPQIIFEGSQVGQTVVSGSDEWKGWQQDGANSEMYAHRWPYHWGQCPTLPGWPALQDIVKRREMIFLNGVLMRQVVSRADMRPGTFLVDESSNVVNIWVPSGTDMNVATIEVSTRPTLFYSDHVSNLAMSRMLLQNSNACMASSQSAAVIIANAAHVTIEQLSVNWNNWHGLALYNVANPTVRAVHTDHNGELGMNGVRLKNATFGDVTASNNNWRGQWGAFDTWETGGAKFLRVHGGVFTHFVASKNNGRGIWFDTDSADLTVVRGVFANNSRDGMFIEKSQGPITIADSWICGNGDAGVLTNSDQVSFDRVKVLGNRASQILVDGRGGAVRVQDWETSEYRVITPAHLSLIRGTYAGVNNGALFSIIARSPDEISKFLGTLHASRNVWYKAEGADAFQLHIVGRNSEVTDFMGWKRVSRQDQDSLFSPTVLAAQGACTDEP